MESKLSRNVWGPIFWTIFHSMAECVGYQKDMVTENDEAEAWIQLLQAQPFVMPCDICKKHMKEYLHSHRFDFSIRSLHGVKRYEWLQNYLFQFHEHVNQHREAKQQESKEQEPKEQEHFTIQMLPERYPRRNLTKEISTCYQMFQQAIERQKIASEHVHRWKVAISRLRSIYGV